MAGNLWRLQSSVLQTTDNQLGLVGILASEARLLIHDVDVSLKGTVLADAPPMVTIHRTVGGGAVPGTSLVPRAYGPNQESPLFGWNGRENMTFWFAVTEIVWQGCLHPKGGSLRRRFPRRFPFPINTSEWLIVQIQSPVDYPAVAGVTFER